MASKQLYKQNNKGCFWFFLSLKINEGNNIIFCLFTFTRKYIIKIQSLAWNTISREMSNEFNTICKAWELSKQHLSDIQGKQFIVIWGDGEKWW